MSGSAAAVLTGRLTGRERAAYATGSLGNNLVYGLMTTYLLVFYTDVFGLGAAAVGTIFLVARIWDALDDPVIGHVVDNTSSRWGRFRPYLLLGPVAMGAVVVAVFAAPDLSPTAKLAWAFVTYLAWGIAFTFIDVPFWSLSAALTQDPRERSVLITGARTVATAGIIAISVAALPMVDALGGGDDVRGWRLTAAVVAVLAVAFTLVCFAGVREREPVQGRQRTSARDVVALFRRNGPLRLVLVSMLLGDMLLAVKTALVYFYLRYALDAEAMIPVFLGLYAVATIGGSLATPALARRIGKRRVAIAAATLSAVASLALFGVGYGMLTAVLVLGALGGVADGLGDISRTSMLADTVDYGHWSTGKRQEGMVFATNIFKTKVASALAGAAAAFLLVAVGYVANTAQSPATLQGLHAAFTLVPAGLAALSVLPLLGYSLSEQRLEALLGEISGKVSPTAP